MTTLEATNLEKYTHAFTEAFEVEESEAPNMKYRESPAWDSIGHMNLMSALEDAFDIMLDTEDMVSITSFEDGKKVLAKYGVEL